VIHSLDQNLTGDKIEHLYLALRSIRKVDQLLIKTKERARLIQQICAMLIKNRSYFNAWIVLLDESGKVVETAEAGMGTAFLPMREKLDGHQFTLCARQALQQSKVVVVDDPYKSCVDCPLSEKYGGRSAMAVRLEYEGKVHGLLCVSIPRDFFADEEEHELLQEMAGDIAFGLNKIALEEERDRTAEALRDNEKRFRDLVENSPTGILIIQENRVVYRNPEQDRISGLLHQLGSTFDFDNIHQEDVENLKQSYERIVSGKTRTVDTDFRFYPPGRMNSRTDLKWIYSRASSIEHKGRKAVLINMVDVTRARELEQLLRMKDKMSSLGHIATGIAHEIRNPLSGINIYVNTLQDIYNTSQNLEMTGKIIDQIQSASRKIESIIKRVIDFSKPSEPRFVLTDINEPIREAIELASVSLRKREIKIETSLTKDLPRCNLDSTLFEEVILNLITNASEAMKNIDAEKRIDVTSSQEDNYILVKVSDSGPGVPPRLRNKIFEPFYTTKNDSTGIGLSLCHRIVTDHGGMLDVNTSRWLGAEFTIKIPSKT